MPPRKTEVALRTLGSRIQELRRAAGETQESLAARLGMLPSNYARIEQGRQNVTIDTLIRICNVLDVDLDQLFLAPKRRRARPGRPRNEE